jgi:hypothetical protein
MTGMPRHPDKVKLLFGPYKPSANERMGQGPFPNGLPCRILGSSGPVARWA